jgi:ATP-dependent DNA helicase RecQ
MIGLTSGSSLSVTFEGLATEKGLVVKFSSEFVKQLEQFAQKGYSLKSADVNFIVHWFNATSNKEYKIVLPEIVLSK